MSSDQKDDECGCDSAKQVVERALLEIDPDTCLRMQLGVAIAKSIIITDIFKKEAGTISTALAIKVVGAQLSRYLKDHDAQVQTALRANVASAMGKTH